MNTAAVVRDPRYIAAASIAAIGSLQAISGTTNPAAATVCVILSIVTAFAATHIALNRFPPKELQKLRTDLQEAVGNGRSSIQVLPPEKTRYVPSRTQQAQAQTPPQAQQAQAQTPPQAQTHG